MTVSYLLEQVVNNLATSLIISTRLLQVVNSSFQTRWQLGTNSANTTCWRLVGWFEKMWDFYVIIICLQYLTPYLAINRLSIFCYSYYFRQQKSIILLSIIHFSHSSCLSFFYLSWSTVSFVIFGDKPWVELARLFNSPYDVRKLIKTKTKFLEYLKSFQLLACYFTHAYVSILFWRKNAEL